MTRTALIAALLLLFPFAAAAAEKGRTHGSAANRAPAVARNEGHHDSKAPKAEASDKGDKGDKGTAASAAGQAHGTKPRVYDFGGLEVEGKLKTPQLLYFRTRVKQELDTSTPEKRSFMKELEKSADDKGL